MQARFVLLFQVSFLNSKKLRLISKKFFSLPSDARVATCQLRGDRCSKCLYASKRLRSIYVRLLVLTAERPFKQAFSHSSLRLIGFSLWWSTRVALATNDTCWPVI